MKTPFALLFIAVVSIASFLMGRGNPAGEMRPGTSEINTRTHPAEAGTTATPDRSPKVKPRKGPDVLPAGKANLLTSAEKIALLKRATLLADPEKQADILCGLISAMTRDELTEATKTLLEVQRRGNGWSQEVWDTLWTQWGRVDAEACLALSKTGEGYPGWNGLNGLNTPNDYRCLMAGWLDTHPEAALAWARQPKDDLREATGAAFAITSSAKGDLEQMESAILSVAGNKLTAQACFQDLFDLAISVGERPSVVYDRLDPALREAAWPVVLERLTYTDPHLAATWLTKHAGDPGCDYGAAGRLIDSLAEADPAGTAEWAAGLPVSGGGQPDADRHHPAAIAINRWLNMDPASANKWLRAQPPNSPWLSRIRPQLEDIRTE